MGSIFSVHTVLLQTLLDLIPERLVDDGVLLSGIARTLMHDLTPIDTVLKQ